MACLNAPASHVHSAHAMLLRTVGNVLEVARVLVLFCGITVTACCVTVVPDTVASPLQMVHTYTHTTG